MSNSQLHNFKSAMKYGTEETLRILSNLTGNSNDDTNFAHELLLTDTQV